MMSERYMAYDGEGIEVGYLTLDEAREWYTSAVIETTDEDGEPCAHTITVGDALPRRCECACGCELDATATDPGGTRVCDDCADYYVDEDGEVICSRQQDETTCRHCDEAIEWGHIQTGQPGDANWREGRCSCRTWLSTERGGTWTLSEAMREAQQ